MVIDRRDLRVLAEGWYEFKIDKVEEVDSVYGPAVKFRLFVVWGRAEGARLVLQCDRVATPGNKTGRLFTSLGYDPSVEVPVRVDELAGRRFGGRVIRYIRDSRVRAKVVEFCSLEKVREKIEDYELQGQRTKDGRL